MTDEFETKSTEEAPLSRKEIIKQQEEQKRRARRAVRLSVPFFAVLLIVTALAWTLPLRPTVSESEKRPLAAFPEFSFRELVSGQYFRDIDEWFTDSFTFREKWISATQSFKSAYGIQTVTIHGDIPVNDVVPVVSPKPQSSPKPVNTPEPVSTPEVDNTEAVEPNDPEVPDAPAIWGGDSVGADEFVGRTTVLQIGDTTYNYPGFNQYYGQEYANQMNKLADILEGTANLYCILVPENASYMLSREDREKYGFTLEEDSFAYVYSLMNDNVGKVNIMDTLIEHNDEYLAFRTDHHWTQRAAYWAYVKFCEVAGKEAADINEMEELAWEGFLGSYFYFAEQNKLLEKNPDTVYCYVPKGDITMYINTVQSDWIGDDPGYLYLNRANSMPGSKYMTFIGLDAAKVTFVNDSIKDDSACVVLKTSFGNPFVYFLTQNYHTVHVLDMRYYATRTVKSYVDEFGIQDVLYVHGGNICWEEVTVGMVAGLIK